MFVLKAIENGELTRLHHEERHSLYRSTNIVRIIKTRRIRWADDVDWMEEGRIAFVILIGKPTGRDVG